MHSTHTHTHSSAVHEAGYTEKLDELEQASNFLHENGILLHYEDSSLLSDLYFVDPQWLCSMLAKVVTVEQRNPFQKHGEKDTGVETHMYAYCTYSCLYIFNYPS